MKAQALGEAEAGEFEGMGVQNDRVPVLDAGFQIGQRIPEREQTRDHSPAQSQPPEGAFGDGGQSEFAEGIPPIKEAVLLPIAL